MSLRRIPVRRSLNRTNLLLGCERELLLMTGLLAFTCVFVAMNIPVAVIGLTIWFVVVAMLRMMAKADPILSKVYQRHIRYRLHYAPRSTPWLTNK